MRYLPAIFVATMLAQVARADVGARSDYEDLLQSPDSRVSLAVVSPGSGFGMFGHAFAIVTRGRAPVTVGAAVSYRSDLRDNAAAGIPGLILAQLHLKGRAAYAGEAFAAGDLIREYSVHQGRTVTVYRLNLSPAQTRKFVDLMISDLADPDFSNAHDYNMATQNCFRRFVLHLNEVLPPAERVDARLIDDFAAPQPASALPFLFHRLFQTTSIYGGVEAVFRDRQSTQAQKWERDVRPRLRALQACAGWSDAFASAVERYFLIFIKGDRIATLDSAHALLANQPQCARGRELGVDLLVQIYNALDRDQRVTRAAIEDEMNRLLPPAAS